LPDFTAHPNGSWEESLEKIVALAKQGNNVSIHCHTWFWCKGIFAAFLTQDLLRLSREASIELVRQLISLVVDTEFQHQYVLAHCQTMV